MSKIIDKTKVKFGRLQPIKPVKINGEKLRWLCRCDCGKEITVLSTDLGRNSNSCGCLRREASAKRKTTHGLSKSRTYRCWWAMRLRCDYPSSRHYYRYGMRGIKVCDEWKISFDNFLRDMGGMPLKQAFARQNRQQRSLQQRKLPMGNTSTTSSKHSRKSLHYLGRRNKMPFSMGKGIGLPKELHSTKNC